MPTDGPLDPFGPATTPLAAAPPLVRAWLRPVAGLLPALEATRDKPVGQLTVPELLTWAAVLGYVAMSVAVAEVAILNMLRVAAGGR